VPIINVLLSYDYELPLGGITGSFDECLFAPTNELLNLAAKINVPLNFFADVLSYDRFKHYDRKDYVESFEEQMNRAYKKGHDVQLHLHPHWKETEIKGDLFIPSDKYGLDSFVDAEFPNSIDGIIQNGISLLNDIIQDENYACIAYRAGGYVLAPKSNEILTALRKNGIKIDSSVCRGYFFKSDLSTVDYSNVPNKANWYLDLNGDFTKEGNQNNGIFEIPIASKSKSIFEVPTALKMKKHAHRMPANRGRMIHNKPLRLNFADKVKKIKSSRMLTFDNYTYSPDFNMNVLTNYVDKFKDEKEIFLSAIGHPKSMGKYSLELMEQFILKSRAKYGNNIRFVTYSEVAKTLNLQ
jgi:hypothetical protein